MTHQQAHQFILRVVESPHEKVVGLTVGDFLDLQAHAEVCDECLLALEQCLAENPPPPTPFASEN